MTALGACGPWQRVGAPPPRKPEAEQATALFDPTAIYRALGYVTGAGQIRFVGNIRMLAGHGADTALAVVALSMQNRYLAFRRDSGGFAATYRVELAFRQGLTLVQQVVRDERVVVTTFAETQRAEESIIYQEFVPIPAGTYRLSIIIRDQNGPGVGRYEGPFVVPPLELPAIATPLAVYRAVPRTNLAAAPDIVTNPRSTVDYGTDSLRFYVETYGLPRGSAVVATALDSAGKENWADTARVDSAAAVRTFVFAVAPAHLSLGRHELRVGLGGGGTVAETPFLVAFSGQWIVANFDDMISLLRYFTTADTLKRLAQTPAEDRPAAWRKFWHDTDPDPATPENEGWITTSPAWPAPTSSSATRACRAGSPIAARCSSYSGRRTRARSRTPTFVDADASSSGRTINSTSSSTSWTTPVSDACASTPPPDPNSTGSSIACAARGESPLGGARPRGGGPRPRGGRCP